MIFLAVILDIMPQLRLVFFWMVLQLKQTARRYKILKALAPTQDYTHTTVIIMSLHCQDEKWQGVNWLQINPYKLKQDETGKNFDTSMLNEDFFLLHPDVMQKGTYKKPGITGKMSFAKSTILQLYA